MRVVDIYQVKMKMNMNMKMIIKKIKKEEPEEEQKKIQKNPKKQNKKSPIYLQKELKTENQILFLLKKKENLVLILVFVLQM